MTHTSVAAARFAESDFRVGHVLSRSVSVLFRRFPTFFIVTVVAFSPMVLLNRASASAATDPIQSVIMVGLGFVLLMVLSMLSSAVILHAAFQDMRGRPVRLLESLRVGLRRFLPLILLGIIGAVLMVLGFMLLIVPGLILYTMWFVAVAACVVERLGPWTSLRRSRQLTKGYRWRIFGLVLVLLLLSVISPLLELALSAIGGETLALVGNLIWAAIASAFSAVVIALTYYDLRVAKEGTDIEQIAAVFD